MSEVTCANILSRVQTLRVSTYMCNDKKKCDQQLNNEDKREYETM